MRKKAYNRIKEKPLEWLWPGYLPLGALTLVDGPPESGKSFMLADIAATISRGGDLPLSNHQHEPGGVLLLSNEDDPSRITKRRLRLMAANQALVFQLFEDRPIDLSDDADLAWLDKELDSTPNCRLLIIDPLQPYIPRASAYRKVAVALDGLIKLAAKHRVTIVGVRHVRKGHKKGHPIDWGIGSTAYAGRARMVLGIAQHPHDSDLRILVAIKSNWGPRPVSIAFSIAETDDGDAYVDWVREEPFITADDVLAKTVRGGRPAPKVAACIEWLKATVTSEGIPTNELEAASEREGFSHSTLKRARADGGYGAVKVDDAWHVHPPTQPDDGTVRRLLSDD